MAVSRVLTLPPPAAQTMGGILVDILTAVGTNVRQTQWAQTFGKHSGHKRVADTMGILILGLWRCEPFHHPLEG